MSIGPGVPAAFTAWHATPAQPWRPVGAFPTAAAATAALIEESRRHMVSFVVTIASDSPVRSPEAGAYQILEIRPGPGLGFGSKVATPEALRTIPPQSPRGEPSGPGPAGRR